MRPCRRGAGSRRSVWRSEEHTSELQSPYDLVCRLLLEKKKKKSKIKNTNNKKKNYHNKTNESTITICNTERKNIVKTIFKYSTEFSFSFFFFFNDPATTEIYTLSLHDALPISTVRAPARSAMKRCRSGGMTVSRVPDRKSTRLNSSHRTISYAVFCLKKKKQTFLLFTFKNKKKIKKQLNIQ